MDAHMYKPTKNADIFTQITYLSAISRNIKVFRLYVKPWLLAGSSWNIQSYGCF